MGIIFVILSNAYPSKTVCPSENVIASPNAVNLPLVNSLTLNPQFNNTLSCLFADTIAAEDTSPPFTPCTPKQYFSPALGA